MFYFHSRRRNIINMQRKARGKNYLSRKFFPKIQRSQQENVVVWATEQVREVNNFNEESFVTTLFLIFLFYFYEMFLNNPEISIMSVDKNVFILKCKNETNKSWRRKENFSELAFSLRYFQKPDKFVAWNNDVVRKRVTLFISCFWKKFCSRNILETTHLKQFMLFVTHFMF